MRHKRQHMKLIGSLTSPYVRKVRVVMAEKKLDFQLLLEDPWNGDVVIKSNPLGRVPCLVMEGGEAIFDSRVIVEYLDTLSPVGKLIPPTGRERIEVRTWEALADGLLDAADFEQFQHTFLGDDHLVYRAGEGPPVLVLAEMPGITPTVADFARTVANAGMTVFLPHLFGTDGRERSPGYLAATLTKACVSRQFAALHSEVTAPATLWLRDLMRRACGWTGHHGAGVVGMCFTGGFALAMLMEPELVAPVLSQPSLPIGFTKRAQADVHMDPGDLKDARLRVERDGVDILGPRRCACG